MHADTPAAPPVALVFKRTFDAPRELVFKAWTDPLRIAVWWGPHNYTNPTCEVDAQPGGAINIHMRSPDGIVYPTVGAFREVVAPERLVFTTALLDGAGRTLIEELNTATFVEQGGRTEFTLQVVVISPAVESAPYLAGLEVGWEESLERLLVSLH